MKANGMDILKLQDEGILVISQSALLIDGIRDNVEELRVESAGSAYMAGEKIGSFSIRWAILDFSIGDTQALPVWNGLRIKPSTSIVLLLDPDRPDANLYVRETMVSTRHFIISQTTSYSEITDFIKATDHANYV